MMVMVVVMMMVVVTATTTRWVFRSVFPRRGEAPLGHRIPCPQLVAIVECDGPIPPWPPMMMMTRRRPFLAAYRRG